VSESIYDFIREAEIHHDALLNVRRFRPTLYQGLTIYFSVFFA